MKTTLLFAALTLIAGTRAGMAAVSLTGIGVPYTQDFNSLASSGTSSTVPDGWAFSESGTNAGTTYSAGTGSSNTGDTYSFGPASSAERALGGLLSGSLTPTLGASFTNNTGQVISALDIDYTGEMWRLGATGRADRLDFQYSLDATALNNGNWIDVDTLDFIAPVTAGTVGALNGDLTANQTDESSVISGLVIGQGATFWIRWNDFNAPGADDGLAVDDFSITAHGASVATPEAGMGTLLTGLVLLGMILLAKALRLRGERQRMMPCPVARG